MEITFIEANGESHLVQVEARLSVMQAALQNGVPGIDGDCGGNAACGTCHVFVDQASLASAGVIPNEHERAMLEIIEGVRDDSRLACQITLNEKLNGLVVHLPEAQF